MAQGERKFSHITVSSDDDEFVIQAGVRGEVRADEERQAAEEAREAAKRGLAKEAEVAAGEKAAEDGRAPAFAEQKPGGAGREASEVAAPRSQAAAPRKAARDDGYRPTTMEDLEGGSMSTMQKAIIAIALAGIVAAVVYYLLFVG